MAEYKLTIKITGDDQTSGLVTNPEASPIDTTLSTGSNSKKEAALWGSVGGMVASSVKSNVRSIVSNEINKISMVRGDYATAASADNLMAVAGMGSTILSGATAGALAGPVGALVGAALATVSVAVQSYQNYEAVSLDREYDSIESTKTLNSLGSISTNGFRR